MSSANREKEDLHGGIVASAGLACIRCRRRSVGDGPGWCGLVAVGPVRTKSELVGYDLAEGRCIGRLGEGASTGWIGTIALSCANSVDYDPVSGPLGPQGVVSRVPENGPIWYRQLKNSGKFFSTAPNAGLQLNWQ